MCPHAASLRLHKCQRGGNVQKRERIAVAALMKLNLHSAMCQIIRFEFNIECRISQIAHLSIFDARNPS